MIWSSATEKNNHDEDPTTKLPIARKTSAEKEKVSSKLTREMVIYEEAIDSLPPNSDMLE